MSDSINEQRCEHEEWINEVSALLPERYDDDAAPEGVILAAVADLVRRSSVLDQIVGVVAEFDD